MTDPVLCPECAVVDELYDGESPEVQARSQAFAAVMKDHPSCLSALIHAGVDPASDLRDSRMFLPASLLRSALSKGNESVVTYGGCFFFFFFFWDDWAIKLDVCQRELLVRPNPPGPGPMNRHPLLSSLSPTPIPLLNRVLLSNGVDVNAPFEDGKSPLFRAAEKKHFGLCHLLVWKFGADASFTRTPHLHHPTPLLWRLWSSPVWLPRRVGWVRWGKGVGNRGAKWNSRLCAMPFVLCYLSL